MRKIADRLLAVCLAMLLLPVLPITPGAAVQTVHSLVLFAQFPDTEGNFMEGRAEEIDALCSAENTFRSLHGYIAEISCGAMQTQCHFPQRIGNEIIPYTLQHERSAYTSQNRIALEMVSNIPIPADIPLDGNGDGIIDNIILVIDTSAYTQEDVCYPCAFTLPGIEIHGKKTGSFNLQNSRSLFENTVTGGCGVLCHEFLHSIGYPDLYRSDTRTGVPVGRWDMMASNSVFVQYPLAYLRASISGWLETADITESGHYTLAPASARSGNRVYLLKTPLSDTEFFAVEFRQAGTPCSEEMDVMVYGTGLVVYRVNTEIRGNHDDDGDEIYVFRPGETGLDAGEGDLYGSCYGGEGNADHIGTTDPAAGFADGALVYSDGTNSGIALEHITIDGDTLSFDVTFAAHDPQVHWLSVAADLPETAQALDMAGANGTVWLTAADSSTIRLFTVSEKGTKEVTALTPGGRIGEVKLAAAGEQVYLLYHDNSYRAVLCTLQDDALTEIWHSEGPAQYISLAADEAAVYTAYTLGNYPDYVLHLYDGETDTIIAESACSPSAVPGGVAYRDLKKGDSPALWYRGETYPLSEEACSSVTAAAGDDIAVAVTGKAVGLYHFADGKISETELPALPGTPFSMLPVYSAGAWYWGINTQNEADLSLYRDGKALGTSLAGDVVQSPCMAADGHVLYAAFLTAQGHVSVKYLALSGALPGDVNADGTLDAADVRALQDWLLKRTELLADGQAGDMDKNGLLDIYDLALLKCLLTQEGSYV